MVTGGRGFLGRHLVAELVADGCSVTVIDVTACPPSSTATERHLQADVRDRQAISAALEGAGVVIHAAFASPHAARAEMRSVNVEGVDTVCAAALASGVGRVVLVSSTIVDRSIRPHPLLTESPVSRLAEYAATRRSAEAVLASYGERGLETAVVRPKTFVGPGRVGGFALVFELIRRGDVVPLLGHGRSRYQLVDVRDLARGVGALARRGGRGVFCFGAREFGSVVEDLGELIEHAGEGARLRTLPGGVGRCLLRAVELAGLAPLAEWHHCVATGRDSVVDISRARDELGWEPRRSNAEALADAFDWYVSAGPGSAVTTHPVPRAHELLRRAAGVVLR